MNATLLSHLFQEELYYFTSPLVVVLPKNLDAYSADEQTLLQKILMSVQLDLQTVRIVVQPSVELKTLQIHSPSRVLIFGSIVPEEIGFYEETPAEGFIAMRTDDLSSLDDRKKKNLWIALRKMFGI